MGSYCSMLEEGEIVEGGLPRWESPFHKDMSVRPIQREVFEMDQSVNVRKPIQRDMVACSLEMNASAQGAVGEKVNLRQSTSPENGSHQGGTANTAVVQQPNCRASEGGHVNSTQSTLPITDSGKYHRCYLPSESSSSKERHYRRKQNCFSYSECHWVLKEIEEVCSDRFNKLLLQQNRDCKKFKILQRRQKSEFFLEQVCSYKIHHAHVVPIIKNYRMKLPKLHFSILCERFHKHMQAQRIKFVKQQINDRNKENKRKARWIFEAKAGYLKKDFDLISLPYSGLKLETLEWHMTDYSGGEGQLKYFSMQSLITQIEAIASNREPEHTYASKTSDASEPILENSPLLHETNEAAENGSSVVASEEMVTVESKSSESTSPPMMEFGDKNGTQLVFAEAAQNEQEDLEGPSHSQPVTSAALGLAKAVTVGKRSDVSDPDLENSPLLLQTNGATQLGVAEEMISIESSSSQSTCVPTMELPEKAAQISLSVAAQNEVENAERPSASLPVTSASLVVAATVATDSDAAPIFREKRRHLSSGNNGSEGPCSSSQGKFPYESSSNICRTELQQQEPPAARPPIAIMSQMMQAEDTSISSGETTSFAADTEQPNMHSNSQSVTHQHYCDSICQTAGHLYQPPSGNIHSVRTGVHGLGVSNIQPVSNHQTPTGSIREHCLAKDGIQSNPFAIELSRLLMLRDLNMKRHKEKRGQLILEREIELAQVKRKYDELMYNADMDILQKKRDLKLIYDKVYKQHILAEGFQFISRRTTAEPNQLPDQRVFQVPSYMSAPASSAMYQPMQSSVQLLTAAFPRQHSVTTEHNSMDTLGRSSTALMHNSTGVMGSGIAYNRQAPHLGAFRDQLAASGLPSLGL